jgi:hypothetical protein
MTYLDGYEKSNKPVDTATSFTTGTELDGSYADSLALIAKLGDDETVRSCFARNLFRFASAQSQTAMEESFLSTWRTLPAELHGNLVEAMIAYVKSPMFAFRRNTP